MHSVRTLLLMLLGAIFSAGILPAQEAADEYFRAYILKGEAERLEQTGDAQQALTKYRQALDIFDAIAKHNPTWQGEMLTYRRERLKEAITRVENKAAAAPSAAIAPQSSPVPSTAFGQPAAQPATSQQPAATGTALIQTGPNGLPSLSEFFQSYENAYRQRVENLDRQNKQFESDLLKWQDWYNWATKEMNASKETVGVLAERNAGLEQGVAQMQKDVAAGRAAQTQLDALKKQQGTAAAALQQAQQKLAVTEMEAKEASGKLAAVSAEITKLRVERDKAVAERDEAMKKADASGKERDTMAAQNLGMKSELDAVKRAAGTGSNKDLLAKNEQLRKDLDTARLTIETLKKDITKKDGEITQLKGQVTTIQGELATLRKENTAYQTQVAELTTQLKDVQSRMAGQPEASPQLAAENQVLRSVILRQLRAQARQQQAKTLIIAELEKTENASKDLLQHVEDLGAARVTLTPEEEKLFTDPQLKEAMSGTGFQATLIASSSAKDKPATATPPPAAANSVTALLDKANAALLNDKLADASKAYEEVLRAEPKNTTALIGLGAAKTRDGKFADAEAALKKCLNFEPGNDSAHFYLGVAYFKQNRQKDAMTAFEASIAKRPQNSRAHHYLGIIATKMSLLDRAEREFKSALAIDPAYGDAYFNLAVLYISWDPPKIDQARTHYKDALQRGVKPDPALEKILGPTRAVSVR